MTAYRFLEPLDVLFLRGNKLFGDPGSYGESLVPPWPSVAAGALRSRILADDEIDLTAFARGQAPHPELGTPEQPGSFTVTGFHLARRSADGHCEVLMPLPADLVVSEAHEVSALKPVDLTQKRLLSSAALPCVPLLAETTRSKPASGYWLNGTGWCQYCAGQAITPDGLTPGSELWSIDPRVGVGLNADTRSVAEGRLFTVQAVALKKREQTGADIGFVVAATGARLPETGLLRLGGDGRAVSLQVVDDIGLPKLSHAAITQSRRCRLVLTTPGIFSTERQGWLPEGMSRTEDGSYRFALHGVTGRLVAAAIPRAEVISGWDLAQWRPKPAVKAVPAGSVYWLDELEASPEALSALVANGLWANPDTHDTRRAEGYNRLMLTPWHSA